MADEKQPPRPRHPTLPQVNDPIGETTPTNDDLKPLGLGRVDWLKTAKVLGKAAAIILPAIAGALALAWAQIKPVIIEYKALSDQRTNASWEKVVRPELLDLRAQLNDVRARLDAASHSPVAVPRRAPGATRRPVPVVVAIPPARVPAPAVRALPKDLDKAIQQAPAVAPTVVPLSAPPRALDAGP
jgi:hypothetical protein